LCWALNQPGNAETYFKQDKELKHAINAKPVSLPILGSVHTAYSPWLGNWGGFRQSLSRILKI
jgi:hypothetical protein